MKTYEVVVLGSGAGASIASRAVSAGLSTALIDKGPLGGTCVNTGCIPSKMLIYPADLIETLNNMGKVGVEAQLISIHFSEIMDRMREVRTRNSEYTRSWIREHSSGLDFYQGEGRFLDDHVIEVNDTAIRGNRIFLCTGARPLIPPVEGMDTIPFHTNETILELTQPPHDMVIIGGGYIATEYAHFFAAMGTEVTIIQRNQRLLPAEDEEISTVLFEALEKRMTILTGTEVTSLVRKGEIIQVIGKNTKTGEPVQIPAGTVLVATGRRSNADTLHLENTGIKTDKKGYILTNEYLETSVENIWAVGDANGKQMFRHAANREALIAWHNATSPEKVAMNYRAVPHAVYTFPRIASVGMTGELARKDHLVMVGRTSYADITKGEAMREEAGFARVIVDRDNRTILGFHIIGPEAPILIQEIANAIMNGETVDSLAGIHIHPSLSELIPATLKHLEEG
ncbi:MAG TPA: dihydrolipoyl dehydrogenase [Methanoregulaceae archaeon]|nr:dihydrolipoyl dehydrogenase [Methanoregulaceae archaeon]